MLLDEHTRRTIYLSEGLADGLLALQDHSTVLYVRSSAYDPEGEHTILATDPEIGIEWPVTDSVRMSTRDREAPTLQHVREAGLLPAWASRRV